MKVLVIVVKSLHAGYLGCYGNDWIETPTLDLLAMNGIVFDQHYADRADTEGAHHAWRHGRYCFPLSEEQVTPPPEYDLVASLRASAIGTALVHDANAPEADFHRGWEHVVKVPAPAEEEDALEPTLTATGAALDRLAGTESWLLWLEMNHVIPPWDVPEEFFNLYFRAEEEDEPDEEPATPWPDPPCGPLPDEDDATLRRLQNSYAAAVTYVDAGLEELLDELKRRTLLEEMMIIVTTDQGLALGEHGIIGNHRPWLHDELIHLPMIVRLPGRSEACRRVPELTQPVDLLPTLLEAFGLPSPPVHGESLMPLLRGSEEAIRTYACSGLRIGTAVEWALRTLDWSFILPVSQEATELAPTRSPQLYVKPDDRWEVNNVVQHHMEPSERLEQALRAFVEATRQAGVWQPPELQEEGTAQETE